ncbi:MAG TPA: FKBP-type peptidyl-prolyl cis-trans isomerase [Chitinophagaceae bacterium]|jgi:FKBP-type peptidyl-prolyl cis-trans isomerase|nr:FKBP-type peptidyl-prolyl cis-trans isomerase [Chitinophagaceae bacterium]
MKHYYYLVSILSAAVIIAGCSKFDYKKTKTGLLYKIIHSGNSKDSVAKENNYLKFNVIIKLNDSLIYTSYGKAPGYSKVPNPSQADYSPGEIFSMLKKGDSAITVLLADSLIKKGTAAQLPYAIKKGDRIIYTFKVLQVFKDENLVQADYNAEMIKDQPRQQKEMQEQMAKERKLRQEEMAKEEEELRKSGEIDKELNTMQNYLTSKKITAQKTGKGTFVLIKEQGSGPTAAQGDTVTVKYTGKILATDSVFQSNSYTFPLGVGEVIQGWDEGIKLFGKGGKGTLFIPGFLAYGKNARPPFRPFEALIFDIEVLDIKAVH